MSNKITVTMIIICSFIILLQIIFSINNTSAVDELTNGMNTIIDVKKDFGAKGDGKTDDTISIQNALNNGSGKSIYFPDGSFLTTGYLSFPDNVNIIGVSKEKSKLITSSGNIFYVLKPTKNIKLSNLSFINSGDKTSDAVLLALVNQKDLLIQNCNFEKAARAGLIVQKSSNVTIENCTATEGGWGQGLAFVAVNGLTVESCNIHDITGVGITVTGACSNFILRSNTCINNGASGISVTGYSYKGEIIHNISNNNGLGTSASTKDGINSHRLHDVVISNNTCNNNAKNGISINGKDETNNTSAQNVTISGNTCNNNKNQGIYLYFTQSCTVDGNTCLVNEGTNGTLAGITLKGSTYNKITNNSVYDSGVVGGLRIPDIMLTSDASHNTVETNAVGSMVRNDEHNSITVYSTNDYLGAIDYTRFNGQPLLKENLSLSPI